MPFKRRGIWAYIYAVIELFSESFILFRLTYRANELETRLELEQAIRVRAEVQCNRQKEQVEKLQNELIQVRSKDMHAAETTKQLQKSLRLVIFFRSSFFFLNKLLNIMYPTFTETSKKSSKKPFTVNKTARKRFRNAKSKSNVPLSIIHATRTICNWRCSALLICSMHSKMMMTMRASLAIGKP